MDTTPNLNLPYIAAAQAQKHVTHNEAIRALDAVVQLSVLDRSLTSAPGTPAEGDRYIVAAGATGAWSGHDLEIAAWQDGAWAFYAPVEGWLAWVMDEAALLAFDGADWVNAAASAAAAKRAHDRHQCDSRHDQSTGRCLGGNALQSCRRRPSA